MYGMVGVCVGVLCLIVCLFGILCVVCVVFVFVCSVFL